MTRTIAECCWNGRPYSVRWWDDGWTAMDLKGSCRDLHDTLSQHLSRGAEEDHEKSRNNQCSGRHSASSCLCVRATSEHADEHRAVQGRHWTWRWLQHGTPFLVSVPQRWPSPAISATPSPSGLREVLGSNPGRSTGYPDWGSLQFSPVPPGEFQNITSIRTRPFPLRSFKIHRPYILRFYVRDTDSVVN
jgi:hypothetical protein